MAQAMVMPKKYFFDKNGNPLAFGRVYTYQEGTTTPKPTYTTSKGDVPNTNPVILNGEGYAPIYIEGNYFVVVDDVSGANIWTEDNVLSSDVEEWVDCKTASYESPTSFSIQGNNTSKYDVGRRVRIDNGIDLFSYASILESYFSGGITVVTINSADISVGIVSVCRSIISSESYDNNDVNSYENKLWQGGFDIWQRGAAFKNFLSREGVADGWSFARSSFSAGSLISQSKGENKEYCIKVSRDTGSAVVDSMNLVANLSKKESKALAGKRVYLNFRARKGLGFSGSLTATVRYSKHYLEQTVISGSGQYSTDDNFLSSVSIPLSSSFAGFLLASDIPEDASQILIRFQYLPSGVAVDSDYFEIEDVLFSESPNVTEINNKDFYSLLRIAKTEYRSTYNYGVVRKSVDYGGALKNISVASLLENSFLFDMQFNESMRAIPSVSIYSPRTGQDAFVSNDTDSINITGRAVNLSDKGFSIEPFVLGSYYFEGIFSPEIVGATVTHTGQIGRYVRVGSVIYFELDIDYEALDLADTSDIQISLSGAPDPESNGFVNANINLSLSNGFSFAVADSVNIGSYLASNTLNISAADGSNWDYNDGKMNAAGKIVITGSYKSNSLSGNKQFTVHAVAEARL